MNSKYLRIISFSLLAILMMVLAVAAFFEQTSGRNVAAGYIFSSPWVIALWILILVFGLWYVIKSRHHKQISRWAMFIHLSLVVLLTGALVTSVFGHSGRMTLRLNDPSSDYTTCSMEHDELPFAVQLSNVEVVNYPETSTPKDYVSSISIIGSHDYQMALKSSVWSFFRREKSEQLPEFTIGQYIPESELVLAGGVVRENSPFFFHGWKFMQGGPADSGEYLLFVSYAPVGTVITYVGLVLLVISLLLYVLFDHRKTSAHTHHHHHHPGNKTIEHMAEHDMLKSAVQILIVSFGLLFSANAFAASSAETSCFFRDMVLQGLYIVPVAWVTLLLGLASFLWYVIGRAQGKLMPKWQGILMAAMLLILWVFLTVMLSARCYYTGHVALTSHYEITQAFAWLAILSGLLLSISSRSSLPYGFLVAGFALLASSMTQQEALLSAAAPGMLRTAYVGFYLLAVVLFSFLMLNGISALFMTSRERHIMRHMSAKMLRFAVIGMLLAIVVGAVWSNLSTGQMWT